MGSTICSDNNTSPRRHCGKKTDRVLTLHTASWGPTDKTWLVLLQWGRAVCWGRAHSRGQSPDLGGPGISPGKGSLGWDLTERLASGRVEEGAGEELQLSGPIGGP